MRCETCGFEWGKGFCEDCAEIQDNPLTLVQMAQAMQRVQMEQTLIRLEIEKEIDFHQTYKD